MKKVLVDLAKYLNVKGFRGIARYLEVPESRIYSWTKKGKIANTGLILAKNPEINVEWLKTGKGPMLAAKVSPAKPRKEKSLLLPDTSDADLFSRTCMTNSPILTKAACVLASGHTCKTLLEVAITATYEVLEKNNSLNYLTQEISLLREEIAALGQSISQHE